MRGTHDKRLFTMLRRVGQPPSRGHHAIADGIRMVQLALCVLVADPTEPLAVAGVGDPDKRLRRSA